MVSPKKIVVLGSSGFIGRSLCPYLDQNHLEVIRVDRSGLVDVSVDALDHEQMHSLIEKYRPDCIINLIGYTDESCPDILYKVNVFPFLNIAEALLRINLPARVLLISSAAEFGASVTGRPIKEDDVKNPISHYGNAKLAQSLAAQVYYKRYGMDVMIGRPFNIIGSDMSSKLVPACFVNQFLENPGSKNVVEIKTKNLNPLRDFVSVTDVVTAIYTIIKVGISGESYNISSGIGSSIRDILGLIARATSTSTYTVDDNPTQENGNTISYSVGDNSKLKTLGWACTSTVENGVNNLVAALRRTHEEN